MAPTPRTQRRQTDAGHSSELGERDIQTYDTSCMKRRLRLRCRKRSLEVNVSLQSLSTDHSPNASPRPTKDDAEEQFRNDLVNGLKSTRDSASVGAPLRRRLSGLLGNDEDRDDIEGHSDFGLSLPHPLAHLLPHSLPHSLPLPSLPPNPLAALLPKPGAETSAPPVAPPVASPPPSPPSPPSPPPAAPPPRPPPPPPASIPPSTSAATGVSGNFGSPTPSSKRPSRTTLSAALPKSSSTGDDSDDDGDSDGDSDDDDGSSSTSKQSTFSTSTRSVLSLTAAISAPYETQSTEKVGGRTSVTRAKDAYSSPTTSVILPDQTARTKTIAEMTTMTSAPSSSGTAAVAQGQEAARTSRLSPSGEKAVIASATIGGFLILLAIAWFLWRSSKRNKSAGRKSVWPATFPSRDIFEGPRRVSSKVGDKFTSMRGRLMPGSLGWCNIDDSKHNNVPENEKTAATLAANTGGLLERRLGAGTPPQHVKVNSYGMVFRTPINGDSMSDILEPARLTPPSSVMAKQPSRQMAAAHLENARMSVSVSAYNTTLQTLAPSHMNTRISDASSLSSGFGDGDIVIIHPPTAAIAVKPTQPNIINSNINVDAVRTSPERKSFSSRFSRNRDTVLTNSSEDLRPRFRPVSSWVRQQSRRTKRAAAASRNEGGVPAVPEQRFDLMMPDGEEPRRVESAMWRGR